MSTEQPATPTPPTTPPLGEADLARLETLLAGLPSPLQPLDLSALDGYLCGVLLQPRPVAMAQWWPAVLDVEGRAAPDNNSTRELQQLVLRRHGELNTAIMQRQWFDPWIFAGAGDDDDGEDADHSPPGTETDDEDDDHDPAEAVQAVLPWVAGFAAAMEHFPQLMERNDPELVEPMALLFMHFDPDDLEDADALLAMIETLEPPADLAEAVQDIVRALMLMADVTRPRRMADDRPGPRPHRRPPPRTAARSAGAGRPGTPTSRGPARSTRKK